MYFDRKPRIAIFCLFCLIATGVGLFAFGSRSAAQIGASVWRDVNPAALLGTSAAPELSSRAVFARWPSIPWVCVRSCRERQWNSQPPRKTVDELK